MKLKKIILPGLLVFIIIGLLFSCKGKPRPRDLETELIILHMNDIHGQIDNFAKLAWLLKQERERYPNVFLFIAGDNFSGNPVVDQYDPKGEPIVKLLNEIKPAVAVLGNHDFDYGQQRLKEILETNTYPTVCANIQVHPENGAIISQPEPYIVLTATTGLRVAVLGLIQTGKDSGVPATHPKNLQGLTFSWALDIAKQYEYLKKKYDLFFIVSHLGFDADVKLASQIGDLDVIIGGHSHTEVNYPRETNGVLVTQAGSYGNSIGRIHLTIKGGKFISKITSLISLKYVQGEDPEIAAMIKAYNDNPELDRVIADLPMVVKDKNPLGNLITDAIRNIHHLDIAFHNEGGIRSDELGKEVRIKDVYRLLPFGNDVIRYEMSTAEIKELILTDFEKYRDFDLKVSGITYTVTYKSLPHGSLKVTDVELRDASGKLLDETKTYKVGFNNYIASSYKFSHKDPGKALLTSIAQTLADYLRQGGDICKDLHKMRTFKKEVKN